jgi:signal transduction histidine kinase
VYGRSDRSVIDVMGNPQEDSAGMMWAVQNERQLVYLGENSIWHAVDDPGQGHGHITVLFVDCIDTIWLVVDDRLYRRPLKQQRFILTNVFVYGRASIKEGLQHDLWITSSGPKTSLYPAAHLQHVDSLGNPSDSPRIAEKLANVLPAGDGSLWILSVDSVLFHLEKQALATRQTLQIKNMKDQVHLKAAAESLGEGDHAFIRGSDGGIWIGGMGGLEHFSEATLVPAIPGASTGEWESCIDSAGALWITGPTGMLFHATSGSPLPLAPWRGVEDLFCSNNGQLALRDESGIAVLKHNRFSRLPLLPGLKGYSNHYIFTGVTQTPEGKVIAAAAGGAIGPSLWTYSEGKWEKLLPVHNLPEVTALLSDSDKLLLGFRSNNIGVLDHGALRTLSTTQPGIGATLGFTNTSYGMFAYGWNGIAIEKKDVFHMLAFARPDQATSVTGLVEARNGDIWINSAPGIVRITSSEMKKGLQSAGHKIFSVNLQEGDLVGPSVPKLFSSSVHIGPGGRLWFSTLNGVVSVDPECIRPTPPPKLTIRSVHADGRPLRGDHSFPPDAGTLTIDYIGIDLTNPRGVSYRYRLDGPDTGWQDVGARKEAIYTHLRPGRYTFEVMAENAYGVWTAPVSVPFAILPHFYQTLWFQLLFLMILLALVWFGIRVRLKFVTAAIRARAEERADERIRISRDLHDTLLQGVQGLLLTFHSAAERVPADHQSRPALEQALAVADRIILEGRDRVKGLRALNLTDEELPSSLEALGADLNSSGNVEFVVTRFEAGKTLQSHVASEIFLIAREAVINAFRHAEPSRVSVELRYGKRRFSLYCVDDGRGFDADTVEISERYGHWGIRGMEERAHKLGASFEYRSSPGLGTAISVGLKATRAYE